MPRRASASQVDANGQNITTRVENLRLLRRKSLAPKVSTGFSRTEALAWRDARLSSADTSYSRRRTDLSARAFMWFACDSRHWAISFVTGHTSVLDNM